MEKRLHHEGPLSIGIVNEVKSHGQRLKRAIYGPRAMGWTALLYIEFFKKIIRREVARNLLVGRGGYGNTCKT